MALIRSLFFTSSDTYKYLTKTNKDENQCEFTNRVVTDA